MIGPKTQTYRLGLKIVLERIAAFADIRFGFSYPKVSHAQI